MRTRLTLITVALLSLIGGNACINLGGGHSPETRYFLLEAKPMTQAEGIIAQMLGDAVIGIGPVTLPAYLDRPQILTRTNDHELRMDEFNQWAEPLKINIPRVMAENLATLTRGNQIRVFPWTTPEGINIRIALDIHRFEADARGQITLKTTWRIATAHNHQRLMDGQSTIEQAPTGAGVQATVEAMSLALADLTLTIARDLAEILRSQ